MKKILSILTASLLLVNCGTVKMNSLLKNGNVEQEKYKVVIPFEYRLGLIILKVEINGTIHDFLLDTGAPTLISKEFAKKLNLESVITQRIGDSQDKSSDLDFVKIDRINIGWIEFLNTGAVIADLSKPNDISCFKIDGIIGANLMKNAIWEFDYENQKMTITNSIDLLNIPTNSKKIHFNQEYAGKPYINVDINGVHLKNILVDLGFVGGFEFSKKSFRKLQKKNSFTSNTFAYGSKSIGLYGIGNNDTTKYAIISDIAIGDINLNNQIINSANDSKVGTSFFKNYKVIFNWDNEEIIMIETNDYDNKKINGFGFKPVVKDKKMFVRYIYNESPAYNAGLKLGDQIIEINGKDYSTVCWDCWCQILENKLAEGFNSMSITILRDEQKQTFDLKRTTFFE